MPSQTFTASANTQTEPHEVWAALQVPETWEAINGVDDVSDARIDDGELVGFEFSSTAAGRIYHGIATPGSRDPRKSLTWNIKTSEIRGSISIEVESTTPGCRLDVTMRVESVSVMASLGFPIIASVIGSGFQQTVDDFATRVGSTGPD